MSVKVKKINDNKKQKSKKVKDPNKFHLGRNTGTYLIIFGTLLGVALLYGILWITLIGGNSYLKQGKQNKSHPFSEITDSSDESYSSSLAKYNMDNATMLEANKIEDLDVKFYCSSLDSKDAHSATFKLSVSRNANTPETVLGINSNLEAKTDSSYRVYAAVCLTADWVNFQKYSSYAGITKTYFEKAMEDKTTDDKTITVSLDSNTQFPMKSSTWPFKVTVKHPEAYLLLYYYTVENGIVKAKKYIIHYSFDDYYIQGTTIPAL